MANMPSPIFCGRQTLDALSLAAASSPRRRKNLNFHPVLEHPAQRLLNAVEPDSYIRPHRHRESERDETFVVLRGAFGLVLFDERGAVTHQAVLRANGDLSIAHVPANTFHTVIALEAGSVFFEAKAGPYTPITDKDFGAWAPAEGEAGVSAYLHGLRQLFVP